jgi:flavin reductase (DIM6/NTAB) family NADH-FMN oxidoreductase RutF
LRGGRNDKLILTVMKNIKINNYPFGPFPVMLIGATVDGKSNFCTAGAGGCVCHAPVLSISLNEAHETTRGIIETGYFSVNILSVELLEKTDYCGMVSAKETDKSSVFDVFYGETGTAPLISACSPGFLCKVFKTVDVYGFKVFFGDLLETWANENALTDGKPDPAKVNPMVFMGANYCRLGGIVGKAFKAGKNIQL